MNPHVYIWSGLVIVGYLLVTLLIYPRILSTINYIVLFDFVRALRPHEADHDQIRFTKRVMQLHGFHDLRVRIQKYSLPIERYLPEVVMISKQLKHRVGDPERYDALVGRLICKHWGNQSRSTPTGFQNVEQWKEYSYYENIMNQSQYHTKYLALMMLLTVYDIDSIYI